MRSVLPILIFGALALTGCDNSCQQICRRMAHYAEDCGYTLTNDEIRDCERAQAGAASKEDRSICRQMGDAAAIREEWTCEDLEDYWTQDVPNGNRIGAEPSDTGTMW